LLQNIQSALANCHCLRRFSRFATPCKRLQFLNTLKIRFEVVCLKENLFVLFIFVTTFSSFYFNQLFVTRASFWSSSVTFV
ncbi:hypothetical protein T4E_330, partial [Trichinella pseudospiralis]